MEEINISESVKYILEETGQSTSIESSPSVVACNYLLNIILNNNLSLEAYVRINGKLSLDSEQLIVRKVVELLQAMNNKPLLPKYSNLICEYNTSTEQFYKGLLTTRIGDGADAKVYSHDGKAYKQILCISDHQVSRSLREICILGMLRHQNILSMTSSIVGDNFIYIISELAVCDLVTSLHLGSDRFDTSYNEWRECYVEGKICNELLEQNRSMILDILQGLNYLHQNGFLHRDIKPENILLMSDRRLVLCDFGSAVFVAHTNGICRSAEPFGTLGYLDITIMKADGNSESNIMTDLWSTACVILEIQTSIPLNIEIPDNTLVNSYQPMIDELESALLQESPLSCISDLKLRQMLLYMLSLDLKSRITAEQALTYVL